MFPSTGALARSFEKLLRFRQHLTNMSAGIVANATGAVLGLLTIPFLIYQFGTSSYGVWALIVLISSYCILLDFGITSATGRLIAMQRGAANQEAINSIISTSVLIYLGIALLSIALSVALSFVPTLLFNIPDELIEQYRYGLILNGIGVAVYFVFSTFNSLLWAYERFDISYAIEILGHLFRATTIFLFIRSTSSLYDLSMITLAGHLLSGVLLYVCSRRFLPRFKVRPGLASMEQARELIRQGFSFFSINASRNLVLMVGMTIVGRYATPADVTAYAVARQLVVYANTFLGAAAQMTGTRAVVYHATGQIDRQRQLFSYGAMFGTTVAFLIVGGFLFFGQPFMQLWQGGRLDHSYMLLVILGAGELLPMSQYVTNAILVGSGRYLLLIGLFLAEAASAMVCGVLLAGPFGLVGIALGVAVNAAVFRGILLWQLGIRLLDRSSLHYVLHLLLPIALASATTTALFWAVLDPQAVSNWRGFVIAGFAYTMVFSALVAMLMRLRVIRAQPV